MIIYLIKLIACSGLLYLVYLLLLQQQKLLFFNRFYLLAILPVAIIAPLLQVTLPDFISDFFHFVPDPAPVYRTSAPTAVAAQEPILYSTTFLWLIYTLVAGTLFIKDLFNYKKFLAYLRRARATDRQSIYSISGLQTPFSFFKRIYVPHEAYRQGQLDAAIIAHEQAHVDQKHSIDVLLMQVASIVFWFNPLVYLIRHAIRQNHEYLADDAVIRHHERSSYQHLIIQWSMSTSDINALPASNFNFLTTKKRLIMLQKKTNRGKLLLMPVLTLFLTAAISLLFSAHVNAQQKDPAKTAKGAPSTAPAQSQAVKSPGQPKKTMTKEDVAHFPEPTKSGGGRKKTMKTQAPVPKEVTIEAVPKIEEVYVKTAPKIEAVYIEDSQTKKPMRINLSTNVNTDVSATTMTNANGAANANVQKTQSIAAQESVYLQTDDNGAVTITRTPITEPRIVLRGKRSSEARASSLPKEVSRTKK
ncbi:MAG: hypothetical protein LBF27_31345 [Sphingobacterium sp.]|jgi:beta-lactamase regulating signal transducer with metallopeptidase domain|nr:hypothetical protein [Sphingobacterium sp.]